MDTLDGGRRRLCNEYASPRRSGERDHIDIGVARKPCADCRSIALDEIEYACGDARFVHDFRKMMALSGAISEGFTTMVQPVARAGATLEAVWLIGQFQGVIIATTPIGS